MHGLRRIVIADFDRTLTSFAHNGLYMERAADRVFMRAHACMHVYMFVCIAVKAHTRVNRSNVRCSLVYKLRGTQQISRLMSS